MSNDYDLNPPAGFTLVSEAATATPAPTNADPAANSAIDAMVAASRPAAPAQASPVVGVGGRIPTMSSPDVRVNTGTQEVTILKEATAPTDRIPDGPEVDPVGEINGIQANIGKVQADLDRVVFDRNNGAKSPAVTGEDRHKLELQLSSLKRAFDWATQRAAQLFEQRAADQAARQQKVNEQVARHTFTNGDPAREKALKEALLRAEADEAAARIVGNRKR